MKRVLTPLAILLALSSLAASLTVAPIAAKVRVHALDALSLPNVNWTMRAIENGSRRDDWANARLTPNERIASATHQASLSKKDPDDLGDVARLRTLARTLPDARDAASARAVAVSYGMRLRGSHPLEREYFGWSPQDDWRPKVDLKVRARLLAEIDDVILAEPDNAFYPLTGMNLAFGDGGSLDDRALEYLSKAARCARYDDGFFAEATGRIALYQRYGGALPIIWDHETWSSTFRMRLEDRACRIAVMKAVLLERAGKTDDAFAIRRDIFRVSHVLDLHGLNFRFAGVQLRRIATDRPGGLPWSENPEHLRKSRQESARREKSKQWARFAESIGHPEAKDWRRDAEAGYLERGETFRRGERTNILFPARQGDGLALHVFGGLVWAFGLLGILCASLFGARGRFGGRAAFSATLALCFLAACGIPTILRDPARLLHGATSDRLAGGLLGTLVGEKTAPVVWWVVLTTLAQLPLFLWRKARAQGSLSETGWDNRATAPLLIATALVFAGIGLMALDVRADVENRAELIRALRNPNAYESSLVR